MVARLAAHTADLVPLTSRIVTLARAGDAPPCSLALAGRAGRVRRVGDAADLAALTDDYFSVPDEQIPSIQSLLTVVGGRPVFARGPFAGLAG